MTRNDWFPYVRPAEDPIHGSTTGGDELVIEPAQQIALHAYVGQAGGYHKENDGQ
jgi:hypothetical protein